MYRPGPAPSPKIVIQPVDATPYSCLYALNAADEIIRYENATLGKIIRTTLNRSTTTYEQIGWMVGQILLASGPPPATTNYSAHAADCRAAAK